MIEEKALQFLAKQGVEAAGSQLFHKDRTTKVYRHPDGSSQTFIDETPARDHDAGTLSDLVALANRFHDEAEGGVGPVVWYDRTGVRLVINDDDYRDDKAELTLVESGLFRAIKALNPHEWHEAKAFVRLLRVHLFGALDPATLLYAVKKVKFESGQKTTAENSRVRESLGREITAQISAAADLPEYVVLTTQVYTTPGVETTVGIKAAVEVDPHAEKFQLVVLPDEIEKAYATVMSALADKLKSSLSDGIPAYQGKP